MKKLTVLHVKVNGEPEVKTVEHTLEQLQSLVGGYLEPVRLSPDLYLIVNEDGISQELETNFYAVELVDGVVRPLQQILGDVFFVSSTGEDFASLDKMQIQELKQKFTYRRSYFVIRG